MSTEASLTVLDLVGIFVLALSGAPARGKWPGQTPRGVGTDASGAPR